MSGFAVVYWIHDWVHVVGPLATREEADTWIEENTDWNGEDENWGYRITQVIPPSPWPPSTDIPIPPPSRSA